jgi:heptosyltransferase-2
LTTDAAPRRILVLAPNWLGDAVMALPAIGDVRRHWPGAHLAVAVRRPLADLFRSVAGIDEVIPLDTRSGVRGILGAGADTRALADRRFDTALLLPNSFASARLIHRAGIPVRWGYAGDGRNRLLTRAVARLEGSRHQVAYYQTLVSEFGVPNGPLLSGLAVSPGDWERSDRLLADRGIGPDDTIVAIAPGAAYGHAKRWRPRAFAAVIDRLAIESGAWCLLLGSRGDREGGDDLSGWLTERSAVRVHNLIGETDLGQLMGILSRSRALVSNDSGAMHLAGALGIPVTAIFGPTNERETGPVEWADSSSSRQVLTSWVWCRPCMLRECPIDHRCMTSISPAAVSGAVMAQIARRQEARTRA